MENFEIIANVPTVQPPITERLGNAILSHVEALGAAVVHKLGEYATEVCTPAYLDLVDAAEGSHLRDQYFAKRRAEKLAGIARQYELV